MIPPIIAGEVFLLYRELSERRHIRVVTAYAAEADTTVAVGNCVDVDTSVLVRSSTVVVDLPSDATVAIVVLNVEKLVSVVVTGVDSGALSAAD